MDKISAIVTIVVCLLGSGGVVIWCLNRIAKKSDERDQLIKDVTEIKASLVALQRGLIMCLENDKVIFHALKTHQINGDSELQVKKMDNYFLSLIKPEDEK
jgi:hypothetical protein